MENLTELLKKYYGYGMNDPLISNEETNLDMGLQNSLLLGDAHDQSPHRSDHNDHP